MQQFIKANSSSIHDKFKDQAFFLTTRPVPSFDQVQAWTQHNTPHSPKIPITKYTLCEETTHQPPPLWEELTELHLTADDLNIPRNPDYFLAKEMRIIQFYENQIVSMQNSKLIPPLSESHPLAMPPTIDTTISLPQSSPIRNLLHPQTNRPQLSDTQNPTNQTAELPNSNQKTSGLSPLYLSQNSAGDSSPGMTSLPLYAHLQLNHQRNNWFESSNFFNSHSQLNSDQFHIIQLQYEQPPSETGTTQSLSTLNENHTTPDTLTHTKLDATDFTLPAPNQDMKETSEIQQTYFYPSNQPQIQDPYQQSTSTQSVPLTDLNSTVSKLHICTFHSTHIPPFTCVQYIGILMQKLAISEYTGDAIRKKNWELSKTLKIRLHLIKQLFLRHAFHKIRESGKDQQLQSAIRNENFLRDHIRWLKHRIHQLSHDYAKKFVAQKSELTISTQEQNRLKSMIPQQPYFHWLASSQEFLEWHTENFSIITDTPSTPPPSAPTQPYLMRINKHPDFQQWLTETFER